jgi:predicted transcriptional regulator
VVTDPRHHAQGGHVHLGPHQRTRSDAHHEARQGQRDEQDEYGMLSFADIAKQVIAKDRAPERVNAYEIMAKPVISVRPDMNTRYCARLFDTFGISHAPVIENEEVLGIVSYYLIALHGLPDLD